ncbi:hypothetical protein SOCEGT47_041480 [Sorangium cellulosum]|uniref:DUF1588 domain-containing protein n=1 Tax=Sorangium cellulosum TaxID=56 RepID=A0A4P2Q3A7_SORCE|nr:DUF1588 domain-containing protein [Sorangium cellulosum]AUX23621.1 hypothetical protein SOCEGT47_041480 [Sorangium cellulosum]
MPRTGWIFRRRAAAVLGLLGLTAGAGALGTVATGCAGDDGGPCLSDEQFFAEKVWAPILSTKCIGCHNPQGQAASSKLVLAGSSEAGFLDRNLATFKSLASLERDGTSYVLLKPTRRIEHGGGHVIDEGGSEYEALSEMVARTKEPSSCETDVNASLAGVVMSGPEETLRMASLELGGRLPTEAEEQAVQQGGMAALDPILDQLLTEEAFYERLKEIYNDLFLTDRYLNGGEAAIDLLKGEAYDPKWYQSIPQDPALIQKYGARDLEDVIAKLRTWTNRAIGREPLELIAYIVRNDRSFKEVLTADYTVVNPFSARAYGVTAEFENDADPYEFVPAKRDPIPLAGVLSSTVFLTRHPTTSTNRNRHRARVVYEFFLGTDILKTAEQPLDQTKITDFNPTMNNAACTVCHVPLDPLAGAFHTFDDLGRYKADSTWYEDMRPPGFGAESVPFSEFPRAIQWVAKRVADDPRFALAAVTTMYTGLTGKKPLTAPANDDPEYSARFRAYLAQYHAFNAIARDFAESDYNLKTVVKGIVKSPYFRARNVAAASSRGDALPDLGGARFLGPEQLHRKIWAVTGYPWRPRAFEDDGNRYDFLLRRDAYRLLYGGIDSEEVTLRITEPNGVMANIADRMANEMACIAVPRDLNLPAEERLLFPYVETTFEPRDANDFEVVPAVDAIKRNIQHLHKRVLGERLELDDPEIERTYQIFLGTWEEGKAGMAKAEGEEGRLSRSLPGACQVQSDYWTREGLPDDQKLTRDENYTVRAWMSVMTYLLSDFRFLYQ